jgi:hypothetical protein
MSAVETRDADPVMEAQGIAARRRRRKAAAADSRRCKLSFDTSDDADEASSAGGEADRGVHGKVVQNASLGGVGRVVFRHRSRVEGTARPVAHSADSPDLEGPGRGAGSAADVGTHPTAARLGERNGFGAGMPDAAKSGSMAGDLSTSGRQPPAGGSSGEGRGGSSGGSALHLSAPTPPAAAAELRPPQAFVRVDVEEDQSDDNDSSEDLDYEADQLYNDQLDDRDERWYLKHCDLPGTHCEGWSGGGRERLRFRLRARLRLRLRFQPFICACACACSSVHGCAGAWVRVPMYASVSTLVRFRFGSRWRALPWLS